MVDADGMPLKRRYYCEREDKLLDSDDIVRGFPVGEDRFVTVEDEELEALAPDKTREIDLSRFVPRGDINPVFFARGYFLAPDENATKAYRLLAKSMEDEQRAGVATFVMREREYIVAIVAERGILRAETLRFHDEIRDPDAIGLPALADPPDKLVEQVQSAIEALSEATLDRDLLTEQETIQARELIAHKLKTGTDVVAAPAAPEYEKDSNVVDLMQVLRERLQGKNASTEHRM